jgi:2-dehydropantoate 2-reductase
VGRTSAPGRAIGCVVYPAAEWWSPASSATTRATASPWRAQRERTERVSRFSEALIAAGLKAPVRPAQSRGDLDQAVGNVAFNPITRADRGDARRHLHTADTRRWPAP